MTTAYLLAHIAQRTGTIMTVGIYSEPTPTCHFDCAYLQFFHITAATYDKAYDALRDMYYRNYPLLARLYPITKHPH